MRFRFATLVLLGCAAAVGILAMSARPHLRSGTPLAGEPSSQSRTGERTPVLVELFTSEGCSSCPPADALLARLGRTQPIPGAEVIILEHHVDYWDDQGWRDPFSSHAATLRQDSYAQAMGTNQVYTPQMVVDGREEFIGSSESRARQAIVRAAANPKPTVELRMTPAGGDQLDVAVKLSPELKPLGAGEVFLAITEDSLHSDVKRGENEGRALDHSGVVRELSRIGSMKPGESFHAPERLKLDPAWKRENLRAVVFVQQSGNRRVLGAASLPLASR